MKKFEFYISLFFKRFLSSNTVTWAASVAFYTALSLAPLVILFLAISPHIDGSLKESFIHEVATMVGDTGADAVRLILINAEERIDLMSLSGFIGAATLALSASLIFGELRAALNQIFSESNLAEQEMSFVAAVLDFIKSRIFQMGLALGFLFIMMASLLVSTGISTLVKTDNINLGDWAIALNVVTSLILYCVVFACMFHFIPKKHIPWRQAFQAAFITAGLFVIGKELVGIYLGQSSLNSSYGAAGSIIVLLAWVYYSALIIFIGAHVSYILNIKHRKEAHSV